MSRPWVALRLPAQRGPRVVVPSPSLLPSFLTLCPFLVCSSQHSDVTKLGVFGSRLQGFLFITIVQPSFP